MIPPYEITAEMWQEWAEIGNGFAPVMPPPIDTGPNRCKACGKFMSSDETHNAYFHANNIGKFHMKEACLTKAVEMLREVYPSWVWGKKQNLVKEGS